MQIDPVTLVSTESRQLAARRAFDAPDGYVCRIGPPSRTLSQNALIHKWFSEIAAQMNDTADSVKLDCKGYQGIPILLAEDADFAAFYEKFKAMFPDRIERREKLKFVPVTSIMTTKQLGQFVDAVFRTYSEQGLLLTIPEKK